MNMAARTPPSSIYKLQALTTFLRRYRATSSGSLQRRRDLPPYDVVGGRRSLDQGLRLLSVTSRLGKETNQNGEVSQQTKLPVPPKFGFSNWVKWVVGSIATFVLPFWNNKWVNSLTLEGKAVKVAEEVEAVAEVVEKVATAADKALEEVAGQLPDNGKLKEAAQALEHVSSVAAKDAQLIENIINKVSDVKQDLEELEAIVEPIVEKIIKGKHTKT